MNIHINREDRRDGSLIPQKDQEPVPVIERIEEI